MKTTNIGLANLNISSNIVKGYFDKTQLHEAQKNSKRFFDIIKNSPILNLEFKVFNNIENKYITEDNLAMRYIDDNIKLFEVYTLDEINNEHAKLKEFINENVKHDIKKSNLYNSISTLIIESLNVNDDVDVDKIHESFTFVLTHIKNNKKKDEVIINENVNDSVIKIAINKFNEKYVNISEEESIIFNKLIKSNTSDKIKMFEEFKTENLKTLENLQENKDKALRSIQKINEMTSDSHDINKNIIALFELKRGLL